MEPPCWLHGAICPVFPAHLDVGKGNGHAVEKFSVFLAVLDAAVALENVLYGGHFILHLLLKVRIKLPRLAVVL